MNAPRFAPAVFTIAFCCVYSTAFALDFPLFRYYPLHGDFSWGRGVLSGVGPAITWYGLMATASLAAGVVALVVPDRAALRPFRNFVWVFPWAAMLMCTYLLRQLFA